MQIAYFRLCTPHGYCVLLYARTVTGLADGEQVDFLEHVQARPEALQLLGVYEVMQALWGTMQKTHLPRLLTIYVMMKFNLESICLTPWSFSAG